MFEQRGYGAASVADIVTAAGVATRHVLRPLQVEAGDLHRPRRARCVTTRRPARCGPLTGARTVADAIRHGIEQYLRAYQHVGPHDQHHRARSRSPTAPCAPRGSRPATWCWPTPSSPSTAGSGSGWPTSTGRRGSMRAGARRDGRTDGRHPLRPRLPVQRRGAARHADERLPQRARIDGTHRLVPTSELTSLSRDPTAATRPRLTSLRAEEAAGRQPRRDRHPDHAGGGGAGHRAPWPSTPTTTPPRCTPARPTRRRSLERRRRRPPTSTSSRSSPLAARGRLRRDPPRLRLPQRERRRSRTRCAEAGITFVGPSPETARRCSATRPPPGRWPSGSACRCSPARAGGVSLDEARGVPRVARARRRDDAQGGGRRRRARHPVVTSRRRAGRGLTSAAARRRRRRSATATLYAEELLPRARHIEVQIVGDGAGAVSHLWERECSIQRRHQKVVEIAPARPRRRASATPLLADAVRHGRRRRATAAWAPSSSWSTPTPDRHVFIEANARLQVEHTVTEEVTGVDLVRAQLRARRRAPLADLGLDQAVGARRRAASPCRAASTWRRWRPTARPARPAAR